jgi:hypothetical protein
VNPKPNAFKALGFVNRLKKPKFVPLSELRKAVKASKFAKGGDDEHFTDQ